MEDAASESAPPVPQVEGEQLGPIPESFAFGQRLDWDSPLREIMLLSLIHISEPTRH